MQDPTKGQIKVHMLASLPPPLLIALNRLSFSANTLCRTSARRHLKAKSPIPVVHLRPLSNRNVSLPVK